MDKDKKFVWIDYAVLGLGLAALAAWSWRKWPDPLIDFGRELYVPWRISKGAALYHDLAFFNGPLSQYVNAGLFKLFGVSFTTLIFANLAVTATVLFTAYRIFSHACGRVTAVAAGLVFLTIFAFAQYHPVLGSMNFMAPYSHEATHGTALALLMILALSSLLREWKPSKAVIAGILMGLAALTKVEIAAAAAVAAGIGLLAVLITHGRQTFIKTIILFAASALAPALLFFLYLWSKMPANQALHGVLAFWFTLFGAGVAGNKFYQTFMGMEEPGANLLALVKTALFIALLIGIFAAADFATKKSRKLQTALGAAVAVVLIIALPFNKSFEPWVIWTQALPLYMLGYLVWLFIDAVKARKDRETFTRAAAMAMWSGLALVLLFKMVLLTRFLGYGFYLAMPAALAMTALVSNRIPGLLRKRFGGGRFLHFAMLGLIGVNMIYYLYWTNLNYRDKTLPVGRGGDVMMAYPPGIYSAGQDLDLALDWIEKITPPNATIAVVPEGVSINYLTRRVNPTPYIVFMMVELQTFGEDAMLRSFEKSPPDYFVIVHKDTSDYGVGYFGQDPRNGMKIMRWIDGNYKPVILFGTEPLTGEGFGIKIERNLRLTIDE